MHLEARYITLVEPLNANNSHYYFYDMDILDGSAIAAAAISAASIVLLRAIWRKKPAFKIIYVILAWVLFFCAVWQWSLIKSWEFGLVYHFSVAAITAWITTGINAERKPPLPTKVNPKSDSNSALNPWLTFARLLLAGPIAGIAACIILLAFSELLPFEQIDQLVISGIVFPLLWATLSVWICATQSTSKQAFSILATTLCSLGLLIH